MSRPRTLAWRVVFLVGLVVFPGPGGGESAQAKTPFTIDDYFRVQSLRIEAVTPDGGTLACSLSTSADRIPQDYTRYGDPTYHGPTQTDLILLDAATGKQTKILPKKEACRSLSWSQDGARLAFLVLRGDRYVPMIWNRGTGAFEKIAWSNAKPIAANSPLLWSPDGSKLYLALRTPEWKVRSAEMFKALTAAPIIVMDSEKPFLPWDDVRRRSNLALPVSWEWKTGKFVELLPEIPLNSIRLAKDGSHLLFERDVTEKTNYDVIGGTKNQLEALPLSPGTEAKPRILLKPYEQRSIVWSQDNKALAYADKGNVFVMGIGDAEPRLLVGEKEAPPEKPEKAAAAPGTKPEEKKPKQNFDPARFSPDGRTLLCTSVRPGPEGEKPDAPAAARTPSRPRQYWTVDVASGAKEMVYELPEKEEERPRLQVVGWSPDGGLIYFSTAAADRYERGLVKFDLKAKRMADLVRTDRLYSSWRLSEDGKTFFYTESDGDAPEDLYAAAADFSSARRLTELNSWIGGKTLSRTELVSYRDSDGRKLYGVLFYPAGYEKGKSYPLITEIYEEYFDNGFNATLNVFTSAGYAVFHPSVNLRIGFPGEAWMKGALAGINKLVEMGVADPDKLGIQGTSYGGYATVLLLTHTDRFKAAINNSGKVDMVSFYSQSPRLGIRNTHAPEKSQDRLGGTMWEYPERYLAHSAILQADRITTPLLCITGDQDPNVEAVQSQEIFIALRRLGKKCVWLRYHDGGHGGPNTLEERKDMLVRMIDWYDNYLKGLKK